MKNLVQFLQEARIDGKKQTKLNALANLSDRTKILIMYALDPYRMFGVKNIKLDMLYQGEEWFGNYNDTYMPSDYEFIKLLDRLQSRELTGNAARTAVVDFLSMLPYEWQEAYLCVLNKNIDCGISETTINKVYPNLIPTFDCMLCGKYEEDGKKKLEFPIITSPKLDGTRTLAFVVNGEVTYLSRAGKPFDHLNGLFDEELVRLAKSIGDNIVFDGETMGNTFQETIKARGSKNQSQKDNLIFNIFDFVYHVDWMDQICSIEQESRLATLQNHILSLGYKKISFVDHKVVYDMKQLKAEYKKHTDAGYEGSIIKKVDARYEFKRSKSWLKWKPLLDVDLQIVGFTPGRKKYSHTLGNILVAGHDENGTYIESAVGSGFTDEDRDYFWNNQDELLGKTVQLEAQEISIAENAEHPSLRFPIFIKIRDDK